MTTITIIEPHTLFRNSLKSLISSFEKCKIVQEASTVEQLANKNKLKKTDLVLISIHHLSEGYADLIAEAKTTFPMAKIVIISDGFSYSDFLNLVEIEIYALFSTNANTSEFERLLSEFDKYDVFKEIKIDSTTRDHLRTKRTSSYPELISFTPRELEVLSLVCHEKTNIEISQMLGVSIRTIESFRRKMILKVGCKNMIGVVIRALELPEFRLSL